MVEEYDAELKRMNTALSEENQALVHDNKQLGVLIKEYEQTLENIMDTFRKRAVRSILNEEQRDIADGLFDRAA